MSILNFGSLNIDHVYRVDHVTRGGETQTSRGYAVFAGGKGANQSVALARAGAKVRHAGRVGQDGEWLVDKLAQAGVDVGWVAVTAGTTGHAIIQVDERGENAIFLYPGANRAIDRRQIDQTLADAKPGKVLLLQNEISELAYLIERGHALGLRVCLNPAPFDESLLDAPLERVATLIVNETEAAGLSGEEDPDAALAALTDRYPAMEILLTRGEQGVSYRSGEEAVDVPAVRVEAVDTTAAGDTFIGYYLASREAGWDVKAALETACRAAAVCVTRQGAMDAIPVMDEIA